MEQYDKNNRGNELEHLFSRLSYSKFRSIFSLSQKDIEYVNSKGFVVIRSHANDFIQKRLAPEVIYNDGKQTPMRGHPVFIAQHATATCCRGCLYKWHGIKPGKCLSDKEKEYIADVIMKWIEIQMDKKHKNS